MSALVVILAVALAGAPSEGGTLPGTAPRLRPEVWLGRGVRVVAAGTCVRAADPGLLDGSGEACSTARPDVSGAGPRMIVSPVLWGPVLPRGVP
jgi:hypothetical protein